MRKLFVLVLTSFFALAAFAKTAPDIIVTDDEEKLEVKIVKVTEENVTYKMLNNLQGPEFVVGVDKITTILYANGDVQNFAEADGKSVVSIPVPSIPKDRLLTHNRHGYMLGDKYLTKAEYEEFLRTNCPVAYDRWKHTNKYWKVGSAFLGVGLPLVVVSLVTGIVGATEYISNQYDSPETAEPSPEVKSLMTTSAITGALGAGFTVASIPIMAINGVKRDNTYKVYNRQCAMQEKPVASLNFQVDDAGVGFALHF